MATKTRPGDFRKPPGQRANAVTRRFEPTNSLHRSNRSGREPCLIVLASAIVSVRNLWRRGLREIATIQEVFDAATLGRSLRVQKAAVLLLDLGLPGLGGVEAVSALHESSPTTKVLVFSPTPRESEAIAALKAGARGYCGRQTDPLLVGKAVDKVLKGDEIWVGRTVIHHLVEELTLVTGRRPPGSSIAEGACLQNLTVREREIARLVGGGAANKEIATKLRIAERTVKAHLSAIFRKLGSPGRLHLALLLRNLPVMDQEVLAPPAVARRVLPPNAAAAATASSRLPPARPVTRPIP